MKALRHNEIAGVNGGFFALVRVFLPCVLNGVAHVFHKKHREEEITPQGVLIASGTGLITGALGTARSLAAGGGVVGNLTQLPGTIGLNTAGNLIAQEH